MLAAQAQKSPIRFERVTVCLPIKTPPAVIQQFLDRNCHVIHFRGAMDETPKARFAVALQRRFRDLHAHFSLYRALEPIASNVVIHADIAPWNGASLLWVLGRKAPVFSVFNSGFAESTGIRQSLIDWKVRYLGQSTSWSPLASTVSAQSWLQTVLQRPIQLALLGIQRGEVDRALQKTIRSDHARPSGTTRIVGVGQLIHRKGIDVAIEAIAQLRDRGVSVVLVWIGGGPSLTDLERLIEERGLRDFVSIRENFRVRDEYLSSVASNDIYIQPSRFEGLPVALLEAMALGLPVVATDTEGVPEVVEHLQTGWLIPTDDVGALVEAIAEIVGNPDKAKVIGRKARIRVLGEYGMETQAAMMFDRYEAARTSVVRKPFLKSRRELIRAE